MSHIFVSWKMTKKFCRVICKLPTEVMMMAGENAPMTLPTKMTA